MLERSCGFNQNAKMELFFGRPRMLVKKNVGEQVKQSLFDVFISFCVLCRKIGVNLRLCIKLGFQLIATFQICKQKMFLHKFGLRTEQSLEDGIIDKGLAVTIIIEPYASLSKFICMNRECRNK